MYFDLSLPKVGRCERKRTSRLKMPAVLRKQVTKEIILDPVARLKQLTEYGSSVGIDKSVPIKRYFRSGAEMERQVRGDLD